MLLLITAAIWGFAFTAQRAGMDHIGPFLYTGVRFLLGAAVLLPIWIVRSRRRETGESAARMLAQKPGVSKLLKAGVVAGLFLFFGVSFQQVGLLYTTAGKAGFITGLYVIIVPITGLLWKLRSGPGTWLGAAVAVTGLYLLSVSGSFKINRGDLLMLINAFFWAGHVLAISRLAGNFDPVKLAVVQYTFCGVVSLIVAAIVEPVALRAILDAAIPLAYGGICSVGIGYTLQVVAQKSAPAAHAAIIMSLESVFAVIGGYLILGEVLSARGLTGCALMLCGMIISQLSANRKSAIVAPD